jgi:zinc protease
MTMRIVERTLIAGSLLALTAVAHAQSIPEIAFEEFYLDNGLHVIVHEDRKAPIVAATIWYHVGSKNEQPGRTGFAHLFEHLMFNGSEHYNDEYFAPFQEVGATGMNGTTSADRTNYFQTVPKTALDLALWMESDRMGHMLGAIDQDKLDEQRGVVQNEKREGLNEPYGTVYETILENLFPPGHPYSWPVIGSMEDLNAASLEDVYAWFETYYGPNNATLVLAGDIDLATAKSKVERYFGSIPPGPPIEKIESWELGDLDAKRVIIEDRVPQPRVYKTWRGPAWRSDDSVLLQLADYVLTSGKTSRLYKRLVYDEQIASDVGAYALDGEIGGAYVVYASALPGVSLDRLEQAIDEELDRFKAEGPTRAELERVKTEIQASFIRGMEQVGGFSGKSQILAQNAVFGGRPDFYLHTFDVLSTATPESVQQVARKWIAGNAVVIEVHPFADLTSATTDVDRTELPMPDEFPVAQFPELERTTLSNGLEVIVATRSAVPVVRLSLQLDAGYAADQFGSPGAASMAMAMLDEGTTSRNALEISDDLRRLGATLGTGSNLDRSSVTMSALKSNLDESLDIFADVILNPSFPEDELERQRPLRLAQIREEKTTPDAMAFRVLPQLLYGDGHAYSLGLTGTGTEESVAGMTRADLMEFHDNWFRPDNATLIVTGDTSLGEIAPKLERLFAGWAPGDVPTKTLPSVEPPAAQRVFLIDNPGSEQAFIIAAQLIAPMSVDDEPAINAMNDVFGGGFTSRINMNLREDKAWSYGARTRIADTAAQRLFYVDAPVQIDKTAEAMAEIARELDEYLEDRPATTQEVETSKRRSTLTLPGRWETAGTIASDIGELVRFDLPDDYWDRYPDLVAALTPAVVNAAAQSTLTPNRLTWLVVGDLAATRESIEDLGFGDVPVLDTDGSIVNDP